MEVTSSPFGKLSNPPIAFGVFLTITDEDLPAGRQASFSKPEIRLDMSVIHFNS